MRRLILSVLLLSVAARAIEISCPADSTAGTSPQDATPSYPVGDIRNCQLSVNNGPQYRMEVLPGGGFDNLRNLDMGQVHARNYSLCQISPDGKYFLPDNFFLIPLQQSKLDLFSEYYDHWDNYTDLTSSSINIEASFSAISGKYSDGYSSMKTHQYNRKSKTTRAEVRHKICTVKLHSDAPLHPTFKSAVFEIATNIQNNNTEYANYLAQLLVRDYGTHYVTSVDTGGVLAKTDFILSTYTDNKDITIETITKYAGISFSKKFSIDFEDKTTTTTNSQYEGSVTHTEVTVIGGQSFTFANFSIFKWENSIPDYPAIINRAGKPLQYAINKVTLPDLPPTTVLKVADLVEQAVSRYYDTNTRTGCTDASAPNFNFQANLADKGACKMQTNNFTFGGIFQNCSAKHPIHSVNLCTTGPHPKNQKNDLTGKFSCLENYTPIKLHRGHAYRVSTKRKCDEKCKFFGLFCHDKCYNYDVTDQATYETYWCAATGRVPRDSGYLFGGFYTRTINNPLTGNEGCPQNFHTVSILENTKICVSNDYELGTENAVKFGGFFSCTNGNPLASSNRSNARTWPHRCAHGYTQHLVSIEDSCDINFCVEAGSFSATSLTPVKLPPFGNRPDINLNISETKVITGQYGDIWVKGDNGKWRKATEEDEEAQAIIEQFGNDLYNKTSDSDGTMEGSGEAQTAISEDPPQNDQLPSDKQTTAIGLSAFSATLVFLLLVVVTILIAITIKLYKGRFTHVPTGMEYHST